MTKKTMMMRGGWCSSINSHLLFRSFPTTRPTYSSSAFSSSCYNKRTNYKFFFTAITMSGRDNENPYFETPRSVIQKVLAKAQHEGEGAIVRRSIGRLEIGSVDPFLMLDEFSVSLPSGFPDHPHRGFETVTYMLEGAFTHQDFSGHEGTIRAGDLQWMTAGRGIIHSEMPAGEGVQKGLQLWINLSSKDKMIEPRYQELKSKDIAQAEKDGVYVRVIAGEAFGIKSPVYTRTPAMYLDFTMKPGSQVNQSIPESWNAFIYIIEGDGIFGNPASPPVSSHHVIVLSSGDGVSVWNRSGNPLRFVLVGGQPLNEPVVQYGPFVMNTKAEIEQTFEDYHLCKNGFEKATHWRSRP
ncbi:uncharacterized protein A4U43_C02F15610 [Asparagus officinalis]|uniref:Pirin-like protein n=1 Tax=Asparagus officinalis TaxID=4686 RepID=A0A5P1FKF6_ASPOF|nr:pirin-like protein [Asparagus officinalis]ONK78203.1 uncharacterized protein A4U43_C02F15610 [Asparagus officinalis]